MKSVGGASAAKKAKIVHSETGIKTEVDYWNDQPIDQTIKSSHVISIPPQYSLETTSTLEFDIVKSNYLYTNLRETKLYLRVKVLKLNNDVVPDTEDFTTVNYLLPSLFKSCSLLVNGKTLDTGGSDNYALTSFIQTELGYGMHRKSDELSAALYYDEDPATVDTEKGGYKIRKEYLKGSKICELQGVLRCDLFNTARYLPPGVSITLRLTLNSNNFIFIVKDPNVTESPYKIHITYARLNVLRHALTDSLHQTLEKQLKTRPAFFPVKATAVRFVNIPASLYYSVNERIVQGILPEKLLIAFLETKSLLGDVNSNPYHFQHFGVSSVKITTESDVGVEEQSLEVDVANDIWLEAWHSLSHLVPSMDIYNNISREKFKSRCFYAFNILPQTIVTASQPRRSGSIRVSVKFKAATPAALTMIIFTVTDTVYRLNNETNEMELLD